MAERGKIRGRVKFFEEKKGYGFIERDDGQEDVFVHVTDLRDGACEELERDDRVEFDVKPGRNGKGFRAINVSLAPADEDAAPADA